MSKRSQLKWHCRRGMKELDILLMHYLEHNYEQSSPSEQQAFQSLLELPDTDLYALLLREPVNKLLRSFRLK